MDAQIVKKQKIIKISIISLISVLVIAIILIYMLMYNVEGDNNIPYIITSAKYISSFKGEKMEDNEYLWNINVFQTNDFYFELEKNKKYRTNETIKNVEIKNIKIEENTALEPKIYLPNKDTNEIFTYAENENILNSNNIVYEITDTSNLRENKISQDGGIIAYSIASFLGNIRTNDNKIEYNNELLNKLEIKKQETKYKISFSLSIELNSGNIYQSDFTYNLPNEKLYELNEGYYIYDMLKKDVAFKRE